MTPLTPQEERDIDELTRERAELIAEDERHRPDQRFWHGVGDAIDEKTAKIAEIHRAALVRSYEQRVLANTEAHRVVEGHQGSGSR